MQRWGAGWTSGNGPPRPTPRTSAGSVRALSPYYSHTAQTGTCTNTHLAFTTPALHLSDAVVSVAWSPVHADLVATGGCDDMAYLWRVGQDAFEDSAGTLGTHELQGHGDTIAAVAFNSTGTLLASAGMDGGCGKCGGCWWHEGLAGGFPWRLWVASVWGGAGNGGCVCRSPRSARTVRCQACGKLPPFQA